MIVKQEIKDLCIYSSIYLNLAWFFYIFIRKVFFFSSFLVFSNAFSFSKCKFSNYLMYYYKSSLDVWDILASFISIVSLSLFRRGSLLVIGTSVHLELPDQSIQNQSLRHWKQMIQFLKLQCCLQHLNFLHQQYWNWCLLSIHSHSTVFRYIPKT